MQKVKATTNIADANIESVWAIISDLENYPEMIADILEVTYLDRSEGMTISSWRALISGSEMSWIQRDVYEPYNRISFSQVEGDMEVYCGRWLLEETAEGVRVSWYIEFDIGIPSLAKMLDPIVVEAIKENSKQMLSSVKTQISKAGVY